MKRLAGFSLTAAMVGALLAVSSCNNQLGNDGGTAGRLLPPPASAKAISNHYVEVRLQDKADSAAVRPEAFVIQSADGLGSLSVTTAQIVGDGQTVLLATDGQESRPYRLTVISNPESAVEFQAAQSVGFVGSTIPEPRLLSAVALNSTTVLLNFSEPMNPVTAEVTAFYHIADPDDDPDLDISIVSAQLGPGGTTVLLTTTPQENLKYTIHVANIDAAFTSSTTCLGTEISLQSSTVQCSPQIRPSDTGGAGAPFVISARTKIAESAPLNPNAAGEAGSVYLSSIGAGVKTSACLGDASVSGIGTERDEELIFTFDSPVQHEAITLVLTDFAFTIDDPVVFAAAAGAGSYNYILPESDIQAAFTPITTAVGRLYFGDLPPLPSGLLLDGFKIRETNERTTLVSVCIAASRRLDPTTGVGTFFGIPPVDNAPPIVLSAVPTGNNTILLSFSEPLESSAADPLNFSISPTLTVLNAELTLFNTQILLTTLPMTEGQEYTITVSNVRDLAGNLIGTGAIASGDSVTFVFPGGSMFEGDERPRVVGAISTGNRSVVVTFSKPMGDSAEVAEHYAIRHEGQNTGGALVVTGAEFHTPGIRTAVRLTTLPQADVLYRLTVVNVQDLQGNQLAPQELLVDPTTTTFRGSPPPCPLCSNGAPGLDGAGACNSDSDCDDDPPCGAAEADCEGTCADICSLPDTDGDGIPDAVEQAGWIIMIVDAAGQKTFVHVTSNPRAADTDGDGVSDLDERIYGCNPRLPDTDADGLTDYEELNLWYCDPWNQDSDGDGLVDGLEVQLFATSPILADTDGDQMSDAEELLERNRNPLIADLPLPQITVSEFVLALNVTSSFTDSEGVTQSKSTTNSATFTQSQTATLGTSETNTTEAENTFGQKIGAEGGTAGFKISGEVSFGQKQARGFSSTVNKESAETSQQEYQESVTEALEFSESRSVTRNIDSAIVQATVNISNNSDIAFSITNIELSMLQQDRIAGLSFRPIATLRPTSASDPLGQPIYNIAPLEQNRGPIIFENTSIFPNRADDLMREPVGLLFNVVNYDVLDELGRNLVFTTQEVIDKTVSITLDFGDGRVELYRVATANVFDGDGRPTGITMERALEIIGLTHDDVDSTDLNTYATQPDTRPLEGGGDVTVEALVRVRDVANSPDGKLFWTAVTSNTSLDPNSDFRSIQLHARDTYLIMFTSDEDEDGLFLREEYLYGSDDTLVDTDGDGLDDFEEVRVGWLVAKVPGLPYRVFPSPARPDSDLDGLEDAEEKIAGTDPNRSDTDLDGLSDAFELQDTYTIALFDPKAGPATPPKILTVAPFSDWAITAGSDGVCDTTTVAGDDELVTQNGTGSKLCVGSGPNGVIDTDPEGDDEVVATPKIDPGPDGICQTTTAAGDDVVEFSNASNPPVKSTIGKVCISAGFDGLLNTLPAADSDDFVRVAHKGLFGTDPLKADTDNDGITDGRELFLGINPNSRDAGKVIDTDGDGLFDDEEELCGSNKNLPDTDRDGIPDVIECLLGFNPTSLDSDGDTLLDYLEFDSTNPLVNTAPMFDPVLLSTAMTRCSDAPNCVYATPPSSLLTRTNPKLADTDGDGRNDNIEIQVPCTYTVFGGSAVQVFSHPRFAQSEQSVGLPADGLNDHQECSVHFTNPLHPDTDGDLRNDGAEITAGLNPLRQDKRITVTMVDILVVDDCDASIRRGMELDGSFRIVYPPSSTQHNFYTRGCGGEQLFCDTTDCCCQSCGSTKACPGERYTINNTSPQFIIREGESFSLTSTELRDQDGNCTTPIYDVIGTMNHSVPFAVSLTTSQAADVGSGDCMLTANYIINIVD